MWVVAPSNPGIRYMSEAEKGLQRPDLSVKEMEFTNPLMPKHGRILAYQKDYRIAGYPLTRKDVEPCNLLLCLAIHTVRILERGVYRTN